MATAAAAAAATVDDRRRKTSLVPANLPPTPPETDDNTSSDSSSQTSLSSASSSDLPSIPQRHSVSILDQDKPTPDHHVPRDSRLIRLTGVHPFNVEAPLSALYNEGFLTTPDLFYVRNHGHVPEVLDADVPDWEFSVEGLVERPFTISLKKLIEDFEQVTYPITLVCAGNRRKEQNVVRKSKGFSWGPAGVSNSLFTGVVMADVIRRAKPSRRARYVCMEGADKLPNGYYGTSVKLNWVMDPNRGIMLAHGQNGEMLTPDHGKPLRAVIPGQIGGRSVKWLKKLIVTAEPSDNWYHIYDNRVLPTTVSPEESANNPKWWMDERYAIYDLNCNSAMAYPAHDEQLCLVGAPEKYRCKGYAYGGGGRRITRVELSTDGGATWRLAHIEYPEDRYREVAEDVELCGGRLDMNTRETCFCWCFWSCDVPVAELADARAVVVRCMDEAMQVQPRDMYWSVLGMMNNPWFRVAVHREGDYLRFEHPTQPALMPGGWMERVKAAGGDLTNGRWGERVGDEPVDATPPAPAAEIKLTKDGVDRVITIDELRKHDGDTNPWFVVNGQVFDGLPFMDDHPGGAQSIISAAGMDATDEFMAIHSETAKAMMPQYHIGALDEQARAVLSEGEVQENTSEQASRPVFLDARAWNKARLVAKKTVSWDSRIFTFALQHDAQTLGLPTGKHLMLRLREPGTGEAVIRAYTPISHEAQTGRVDVLVKVYFDGPARAGGRMSQALDALGVGGTVEAKGPVGKFEYEGRGVCAVNGRRRRVRELVMICGGSGVTPIFQVLRAAMQDSADAPRCVVLCGNRGVDDILCRAEMEALAEGRQDRCTVLHTLTQAPDDWQGLKGRISAALLQEHAPCCHEKMALVCGPAGMEKAVHQALLEQGWKDEDLLFF